MFTGLVEACPAVRSFEPIGAGARLVLEEPALAPDQPAWEPRRGESLSLAGCCLTLIEIDADGGLAFDVSAETLACTWFDELDRGRPVNLERSLRLADRLGGHLVSGHVDAVGRIAGIEDGGDGGRVFTFEVPAEFARYLVPKGSVCLSQRRPHIVGRPNVVADSPESAGPYHNGIRDRA